ncbi:MAG: hypothetical protein H8D24_06650 [Gammaproteobacteria bacterium]|uniref:Uncharacterized protein n=1 Tax=Candidatus Thiopontia autotrophica TaxID=2841688 RepID=A0A8J6TQJ0_9GAMM|nr:hypothetical protein [Candidatus Thiopontia autotrophica]MBL6968894.1 hypothetical protein [Gammaproteobacteria bacterium]
MRHQITLQQFRMLRLPVALHRAGQFIGVAGVCYWFWWVLVEKGFLQTLLSDDLGMQAILLGVPLVLILPAIYYTALFILLRVLFWLGSSDEEVSDEDTS